MTEIARELARTALKINAIKLRPKYPFLWASGFRMPIYNDNRMFLGDYDHRKLISQGFVELIQSHGIKPEVIAGTATAGIPPGTTLADVLKKPFIYVRSEAKGHGLQNQIEGILKPGQSVLMIEDLVSTGGSSISAIQAIREANGTVDYCFSIFSYGMKKALDQFTEARCSFSSILTYQLLLEEALSSSYISNEEHQMLADWYSDPFGWGERHGFPPKKKSAC